MILQYDITVKLRWLLSQLQDLAVDGSVLDAVLLERVVVLVDDDQLVRIALLNDDWRLVLVAYVLQQFGVGSVLLVAMFCSGKDPIAPIRR